MAILKAFKGLRPRTDLATQVASRPYDVLNSEEARKESEGNPYSLLHIIKPEIAFEATMDEHAPEVYDKAVEKFKDFQQNGWLEQDKEDKLYIYAQTMNGRTQYGIVGCAAVDDYMNGVIKKHELTRADKEEDRMKHVRNTQANMEPVFFSYPAVNSIDAFVEKFVANHKPVYDFVAEDGFGHHFWVIDKPEDIQFITKEFAKVPNTYIADGHHRTAAAALVGKEMREKNPNHTGEEEYNFFLAVHFPDNQLKIIDYNRVVKDLNGMATTQFLDLLKTKFDFVDSSNEVLEPQKLHQFSMYIEGKWYRFDAKPEMCNDDDPIQGLDVTILSDHILNPVLGIKDLRRDKRIDFVGGIRGLKELSRRVDSNEVKVAFALYPVSMKQLINIADTDNIMPPKTTWFEPKLRSGLVVHKLQ
ncbi:DUF1015 family protein [Halosquirtibacter laminarini]|uniref:DUF1015 family protein n=1 Tax=Halosquirtibacter laminarini TaxID=3374600 RepID=A0AC61NBQ5_9BACT|nr:DUF1015 family protein [Prolixibacteraceae bacterium]